MAHYAAVRGSGALRPPLSFSFMQNDQFVFMQINLDKKEFNEAQAEPEIVVISSGTTE